VAGSCEHGNEPAGSIKDGELSDYQFLLATGWCQFPRAQSGRTGPPLPVIRLVIMI
jgi:hypothetical protein